VGETVAYNEVFDITITITQKSLI